MKSSMWNAPTASAPACRCARHRRPCAAAPGQPTASCSWRRTMRNRSAPTPRAPACPARRTFSITRLADMENEWTRYATMAWPATTKSWNWACAAWPPGIYDDQGKLVAGLSISAPADRLDESWMSKLQSTAQEISSALASTQPPGCTASQPLRAQQPQNNHRPHWHWPGAIGYTDLCPPETTKAPSAPLL